MMNPQEQLCPKCGAQGKSGQIKIHSRKQGRYRCKGCGKTFGLRQATALYGLKKSADLFVIVVTLLAFGCPLQAIVAAYGLDERTVSAWLKRAGNHCQKVHEQWVSGSRLDLQHIQADELKVQSQRGVLWVGMIMMVQTRLWLGGAVSARRDEDLLFTVLDYARRCALVRPLLVAVDGLNLYLKAIQHTFGVLVQHSKRRFTWLAWSEVAIVQVMKQRHGGHRHHFRQVIAQGTPALVARLIEMSQGTGNINTAFIERLNATFRQRLACLSRRSRATVQQATTLTAAMFLVGTVYNWCAFHDSLSLDLWLTPKRCHPVRRTPAMSAGLTDHRWSVEELMRFRALPISYSPPPRPKRSHLQPILLGTL